MSSINHTRNANSTKRPGVEGGMKCLNYMKHIKRKEIIRKISYYLSIKDHAFAYHMIIRVTPGNASSVLESKGLFSLEKHVNTNNYTLVELVP